MTFPDRQLGARPAIRLSVAQGRLPYNPTDAGCKCQAGMAEVRVTENPSLSASRRFCPVRTDR
jgi:hypothetical protein